MKKRLIAYHLPQFHSIAENDRWWGIGYTEWTCLRRWMPYFKGHKLRRPERLGYYNLLDKNVLEQQYEIAQQYGIEGFCFWTYWFGEGNRLLEKPLAHLLQPESKVKYCIAWANHDWFDKSRWLLLQKQNYLGPADYERFFYEMLPHFQNKNYIKKDNKPVISIFMVKDIPDLDKFVELWNSLAKKEGFPGFYFISDQYDPNSKWNQYLDAYSHSPVMFRNRTFFEKFIERMIRYHSWTLFGPMRYSYSKLMKNLYDGYSEIEKFIPTIFSGWDTTPRHAKRGVMLLGFNVETFRAHVRDVFSLDTKNEFIFIKSWNEWAEGNLLEPDDIFGDKLLEVIKEESLNASK